MYGNNNDITADISIEKGVIKVAKMHGVKGYIQKELDKLLILRDLVDEKIRDFEKKIDRT